MDNDYDVDIVNHKNEQHYVIQDKRTGMTYAVYVTKAGMIGSVCTMLTAHVDKVYNMGRIITYMRNTPMYNMLYDIISQSLGG